MVAVSGEEAASASEGPTRTLPPADTPGPNESDPRAPGEGWWVGPDVLQRVRLSEGRLLTFERYGPRGWVEVDRVRCSSVASAYALLAGLDLRPASEGSPMDEDEREALLRLVRDLEAEVARLRSLTTSEG